MSDLLRFALPGGAREPGGLPDSAAAERLLAEADRWGVWPAVAGNLGQVASPRRRALAARNLWLAQEQRRLLDLLAAAGIKARAVKGTDLTAQLYPDLSWREVEDVDLLVEPEAAGPAAAVLSEAGLRPNRAWSSAGLARQLQHSRLLTPEVTFTAPSGLPVELHWDWPGVLPSGDLMEQPEHYLVYLCAHAGKHVWRSLKWTCDICLLVRRHAATLDWPRFWRLAEAQGAARSCAISLELARRWFGTPPAPGLEAHLGRNTRGWVSRIEAALLAPSRPVFHPVWTRLRLAPWRRRPALLAAWVAPQPHDWNNAADRGWSAWRLYRERARHLLSHWMPRPFQLLAPAEWPVLAEAYFTVAGFEALRRVAPVRWLVPQAAAGPLPGPAAIPEQWQRLAWLVDASANRQPWKVQCLTRSLALVRMLRRRGVPADIRIGVRRGPAELEAHAWVEWRGQVLHDPQQQTPSYAVLPRELARR